MAPSRTLAMVGNDLIEKVIKDVQVNGHGLTVFGMASVSAFFEACRDLAKPDPPAQPLPASTPNPSTTPGPTAGPRLVRHNLVVSQTDDTITEVLPQDRHIEFLENYEKLYGKGADPPAAV